MMSLWVLLAPPVSCGWPVCLRLDDGQHHHGIPDLVRILRDGSCFARFVDGSTVTIPALKEHLT